MHRVSKLYVLFNLYSASVLSTLFEEFPSKLRAEGSNALIRFNLTIILNLEKYYLKYFLVKKWIPILPANPQECAP